MRPDDSAIILYTSGTTANPKGCVYNHDGMATQAFDYAGALELTPDDRFWTPLPLFHVSGLVTLLATLAAPCALCHVGRRFDPGAGARAARARAVHARLPGVRDHLARGAEPATLRLDRPERAAARDRRRLTGRAAADAGAAAVRDAGLLVREHGMRRLRLDRPYDRPTRARA